MQEPSEDAEAEADQDDEGASEDSQAPVNDLYDNQGVLMCQMDAFIDLRSMLPGAELSRLNLAPHASASSCKLGARPSPGHFYFVLLWASAIPPAGACNVAACDQLASHLN